MAFVTMYHLQILKKYQSTVPAAKNVPQHSGTNLTLLVNVKQKLKNSRFRRAFQQKHFISFYRRGFAPGCQDYKPLLQESRQEVPIDFNKSFCLAWESNTRSLAQLITCSIYRMQWQAA